MFPASKLKKKSCSNLVKIGVQNILNKSNEIMKPSSFCDDKTNISIIHDYVLSRLKSLKNTIPSLQAKKKEFEKKLSSCQTQIEYRNIKLEMEEIDKAIKIYEEDIPSLQYLKESYDILNEWKDYVKEYPVYNTSSDIDPDRLYLVRRFIQIVENYITDMRFEVIKPPRGDYCPYCWKKMEMLDEETLLCFTCDYYRSLLVFDYVTESVADEKVHTSNNYVNRLTYIKYLEHYQGLQDPGWDPKNNPRWNIDIMKKQFREYCDTHQDPPLDKVTPDDTIRIFGEMSTPQLPFNRHYKDAILFTHMINGWELPTLTEEQERGLLHDHDEFYSEYPNHRGDKDSSLNCPFINLKFMQRRGIPYNIKNIKLARTDRILALNDATARSCFAALEERRIREGRVDDIPWAYRDTV